MSGPVFILGGDQTDFAFNWSRHKQGIADVLAATVEGAFAETGIEPKEVEVAHIGNFASELFVGQGQLGGLFANLHPDLAGVPAVRHEAACAAGSAAILAASAEIEAGRYELACVLGVEQMRNVPGEDAARHLGVCAWAGREAEEARYVWPHLFDALAREYEARHGLDRAHLVAIGQKAFSNARRNPKAQTRGWTLDARSFAADDERNPVVEGGIRRHDCSQITDGGAALFLASAAFAERWAARRGLALESVPRLRGWGHRTAPMPYAKKVEGSRGGPFVFPELRRTIQDAYRRAGISGPEALDVIETHDCFTITEYMAIDHFGITPPGESWRAIEDGRTALGGRLPINPGGGLIGIGHPIGATGIRMVLDVARQLAGKAGDHQVPGARTGATLNIGGSATTSISFVLGV